MSHLYYGEVLKLFTLRPSDLITTLTYVRRNNFVFSRKECLLTTTLVILFPLYLPSLKKREKEKENELVKIVINGHAFLCLIQFYPYFVEDFILN